MSKPHQHPKPSKLPKSPARQLRVTRSLRLRLDPKGAWLASISKSSGEFFASPDVLELLATVQADAQSRGKNGNKAGEGPKGALFASQLTSALRARVQATLSGLPDAKELEQLLQDLTSAGVLVDDAQPTSAKTLQEDGFGDPWIQWAMISDRARTAAYERALEKKVTPASVVLDVGAGSGVLSACALKSGAKQVFAIEETASAQGIGPVLEKMGLPWRERFKLLACNSHEAQFPRQVSLVVSELFGNDPFQEGLLPTLRDIGARVDLGRTSFIPQNVTVFAEIIDLKASPVLHRIKPFAALSHVQPLTKQAPSKSAAKSETFYDSFLATSLATLDFSNVSFAYALEPSDYVSVSEAFSLGLVALDPPSPQAVKLQGRRKVTLKTAALAPVCLVWFRANLCEGVSISSGPAETDTCEHWSPLLIPLRQQLKQGDALEVCFELSEEEDFLGVVIMHEGKRIGAR